MHDTRDWRRADYLVVLAFAALHAAALAAFPIGGFGYDSGQYLSMMPTGFSDLHPIGYARFLSVVRSLSASPVAPFVANHVVSFVLAIALFTFARRRWSTGAAFVATLVYVLGSRSLVWDAWLLSESLALALLGAQLLLVARPGGVVSLPTSRLVLLGLVIGGSVLVRSAAFFAVPGVLAPPGLRGLRAIGRRYVRNLAVVAGASLVLLVPAGLAHRDRFGSFSVIGTQAAPWNLLYGHPETARCRVVPTDPEARRVFCAGYQAHAPGTLREFGLSQIPGAPGTRLLARFGSFRAAGPHLASIMHDAILAHPLVFLRESIEQIPRWFSVSDEWYLPGADGFVHDRAVEPLFRERFPGDWHDTTQDAVRRLPFVTFRIERGFWLIGWMALVMLAVKRRRRPHRLHWVPIGFALGTILTAFGEPRYFAPIELSVWVLALVELGPRAGFVRGVRASRDSAPASRTTMRESSVRWTAGGAHGCQGPPDSGTPTSS